MILTAQLLSAPPAEAQTTTQLYDLRALQSAWSPGARGIDDRVPARGVDVRMPLRSCRLDVLEPESYDLPLEEAPDTSAATVFGWAMASLPRTFAQSVRLVESGESWLRVEADAAAHAVLSERLSEVEERLLASVDIAAFVLPSSALARMESAVLDAEQVAKLLAEFPPEAVALQRAVLGRRAVLAGTSREAILGDYDVEVAQFMSLSDPAVLCVLEGFELGVVVRETLDDGLFVRAFGRRGTKAGDAREVVLETQDGAVLTLPRIHSELFVGSARIPMCGALALGLDGPGAGVVLVRATPCAPPNDTESSIFVPTAYSSAPRLLVAPTVLDGPHPSAGSLFEQGAAFLEEIPRG